ncbi:MAG: beta-lactamase family protein [Acidobacteria bacterium]|nr:beta-lactamase family protein [Acidobacteriota bacterium]
MRILKALSVAVAALAVLAPHARAQSQSLPVALFERYLDSLRQQAGVPGLSAAIVQGGRVVWDRGYGHQEVDGFVPATADTPYPLLDISQALSSTVLLQQCLDLRHLELTDRVRRWLPQFAEESTTVAQVLSHAAPGSSFRYDTGRYAAIAEVIEQCVGDRYSRILSAEMLDRLGMSSSVPGHDLSDNSPNRRYFSSSALDRYAAILRRTAVPYKVDSRGRPTRSDYSRPSLGASTGIVSTVRDLARFDAALDDDVLLAAATRERAWRSSGSSPSGLGWFVQTYNNERIVWHFGLERDAYSALYIKVPGRDLSLILLANSDGLAAPYTLSNGNVTVSLFAQLFLKLFVA